MMNMFQLLIAPGRISAHTVFISPKFLTTRNVGIRPPENSIVKVNRKVMNLRALKSRRERG